jgi:hypothetical protein
VSADTPNTACGTVNDKKEGSAMVRKRLLRATFGATVLALTFAGLATAGGDVSLHTMYLTFSGPVALPGVELGAGTYIFERADANMDPKIVRVLSRDRRKVYLTAFTNAVYRPVNSRGEELIAFGESRPGQAKPISVWFPRDSSLGHQFIYGK